MRRSAAPSSRHGLLGKPSAAGSGVINFTASSSSLTKCGPAGTSSGEQQASPSGPLSSHGTPAVRSTASVLSLLGQLKKSASETEPLREENVNILKDEAENFSMKSANAVVSSGNESASDKRIFRVVYGKPTTKKHKTWEGDGTLEVGEKSATLKDEDGKVIGQARQVKTAELEEGSRLKVGSKEVELIDLLSGPGVKGDFNTSCKRPATEPPSPPREQMWKKPKKRPSNSVFKFTTEGCEPLVLPTPSNEHQWTFNTRKLPVTQVAVDSFLTRILRPHQKEGVIFMYECVMGMKNLECFGSILADEMGLGKTLQTISLIWTLLRQGPYGSNPVVRRVLIVCPSSLVLNWQKEFIRWLGKHRIVTYAVDQKNKVSEFARLPQIPVMLISYEMLMRNFEDISQIKFDILVCDEGHRLKNNNIRTSILLSQLEIRARVLLTGTPIQNDLQEYYALVNFVNPGILGSEAEFRKRFEEPIVVSRQPNCSNEQRIVGEERAVELNAKTSCFILRRTQAIINQYLPSKREMVLFLKPSSIQKTLYRAALDWWENRDDSSFGSEGLSHLGVMTALKKICNHPALIRSSNFFEEDSCSVPTSFQESLLQELSTIYNTFDSGAVAVSHSAKLLVVRRLLEEIITQRERVVLVSYFTQTLDVLASLCDEMGLKYCRLDGSTPTSQRNTIVEEFNSSYSRNVVFLLSARAGGVGLNLTGASRLVLFDSDWNPASDAQAMSRIWRDGQRNSVYIYRLLTCGTIEEKIFQRQLSKAGLSGAVVDPLKQSRIKLSDAELKDLFTFHDGNLSLTHSSLGCNCEGSGEVPLSPPSSDDKENVEEEDDDRDCRLRLGSTNNVNKKDASDLRMNQLFEWEHHGPPFSSDTLQTLGLRHACDLLVFMFMSPPVMVS